MSIGTQNPTQIAAKATKKITEINQIGDSRRENKKKKLNTKPVRASILKTAEAPIAVPIQNEFFVEHLKPQRRVLWHLIGQVQGVPLLSPVVLHPIPLRRRQEYLIGGLHCRRGPPPRPRSRSAKSLRTERRHGDGEVEGGGGVSGE